MVFLQTFPRLFSWRFLFYLPFIILLSFVAFWVYLSTESIPNLIGIDDAKQEMFHYIVVGGGTAGCILASKLSENPAVTVLLIEAGSTFSPLAMVPLMTIQQQKTSVDWQLRTTSQKYSSIGLIDQVSMCYTYAQTDQFSIIQLDSIIASRQRPRWFKSTELHVTFRWK